MPTQPGSPVLDLEPIDTGSPNSLAYPVRVELDDIINTNYDSIDQFAGQLTASYTTTFRTSGVISTLLTSDVGSEYANYDRVITGVKAWHAGAGSSGVTTVNVLRQEAAGVGTLVSIFSNAAFYPAVSQSLGAYVPASGGTISGSIWKAGTVLVARVTTAAVAAADLTVSVTWKPSGSYGSI